VRLFIAIAISSEIRATISALLSEMRACAPKAKWVRPDNLHVTLKFLGETAEPQVAAIQGALSSLRSAELITAVFRGLGFFPSETRPSVLWAGAQLSSNAQTLASSIDQAMHTLGFPLEQRPFTPHLTLARFPSASLSPQLQEQCQKHRASNFGSCTARQFHLMESRRKPSGAEYTILQSFDLTSEV